MIDRHPNGMEDDLLYGLGPMNNETWLTLHDRPSERMSVILGPDGEPFRVPVPRMAIGFDLRRNK